MRWINSLSWMIILILVATLGIAPFKPEPHIVEKLAMLANGVLARPIDIFDLFLHGIPWVLLILKTASVFFKVKQMDAE